MLVELSCVYIFPRLLPKSIVTGSLLNCWCIASIGTLIGEKRPLELYGGLVINRVSAYTGWMLFGLVISAYD